MTMAATAAAKRALMMMVEAFEIMKPSIFSPPLCALCYVGPPARAMG
jgi:hypothetical protein